VQLIEIFVASSFRANRISLETVRRAYGFARQRYGIDYPFAHLKLDAIGGHIVYMMDRIEDDPISIVEAADSPDLHTLPGLVSKTISRLEYEN